MESQFLQHGRNGTPELKSVPVVTQNAREKCGFASILTTRFVRSVTSFFSIQKEQWSINRDDGVDWLL
jgi:hypothetical protein